MAGDTDLERTRRYATGEIKRILDVIEPTADRLFARARTVLGQDCANWCLDLAKEAPLTRRWVPMAAIASLVAGTQDLGLDWWTRVHEELADSRLWVGQGVPETLLNVGHGDPETEDGGSCLAVLGEWISDDAANKEWGRPVDRVDMRDSRVDGRIVLPETARTGDRLTAIFAPGGRVWVDVVDGIAPAVDSPAGAPPARGRVPSKLGSRLAERRHHQVALIRSAWSLATSVAPIRLPGEMPGRARTDPFADPIEADVSRRLYEWAKANAMVRGEMTGPWRTKDALWSARLKLGLLHARPGAWIAFDDAVTAVVDDDRAELQLALAALDI